MKGLRLTGLRKEFPGTVAVDALDLEIAPGEFVSLVGPSGCGKTTTLRMLAGIVPPTAGTVELDGDVLSRGATLLVPPERREMAMIFQSYAVWPHMTVFENVAYGLKLRRLAAAEIKDRVRQALEVVRMADYGERYPNQLSGGQQQRVGLARALAVEPAVLLMDEPLSNLDASLREEMRFEIRRLHDEFGITTVYVTHDISEAIVTSDRIVVMNLGQVEQIGTPEDVYERPTSAFAAAFMGPVNFLPALRTGQDTVELEGTGRQLVVQALAGGDVGERVTVAFRPHEATFAVDGSEPPASSNRLQARVVRQIYLGHTRDYAIEIVDAGVDARVLTPPDVLVEPGRTVGLDVPADKCRLVGAGPVPVGATA